MGYNERTVGGGPATGLAENFTSFLNNMITTGSFGGGTSAQQAGKANPSGDTQDIFGLLNSLVSNPSADASVQELISKDITRGRNDLRARFGASGGMGFGTPAAVSEGVYQAEQAPRTAIAMDEMAKGRVGALMPFFEMLMGISGKGIPQAEATLQPNKWLQGINLAMDVANTAANFIPGGGSIRDSIRLAENDQWAEGYTPGMSPNTPRFRPLPTVTPIGRNAGQQRYGG